MNIRTFFVFVSLACWIVLSPLCSHESSCETSLRGGLYLFAAPLYWKAKEAGTENWGQILDVNVPNGRIDVLSVHFKWDSGFRAGIGYRIPHDLWDTQLSYTYFHTQGRDHARSDSLIASSFIGNFYYDNAAGFAFSGPQYHEARIKWNIDFDIFDWELGRRCFSQCALNLRPFIGVKGGRIYQKIRSEWKYPNSTLFSFATETLKNNFRGLGPSAGLDMHWKLWRNEPSFLALFGSVSGAILWGKWIIKDIYRNDHPYTFPVNQNNPRGASTMFRLFMGLEWTQCLQAREAFFSARVGFEAQYWFDQLQFYSFNMGRLSGQLTLQGLTGEFRFEF